MTQDHRLPRDLSIVTGSSSLEKPDQLTVACYTFPHYHRSAYNDRLYGPGWTEYVLARGCRPWFEGHHQPRTPMLGDLDEREPSTWRIYNRLAAEHGVDVFIWDCYWFDGQPALHEALEEGFLGSDNIQSMGFAVMWTNHIWPIQYPVVETNGTARHAIASYPPESPCDVWRSLSYLVARYLHHPSYWRIDGKPVLVIWSVDQLVATLGKPGAKDMLLELRRHAQKLGHDGLHLHATQGSQRSFDQLVELGFESYGLYNPIMMVGATRAGTEETTEYDIAAAEVVQRVWPSVDAQSPLPCFPSVSPGWDTTPRYAAPIRGHWPDRSVWPGLRPIIVNETPGAFEALVRAAFGYLNSRPAVRKVMTVGCWNEWTEGQYMLPDTKLGYGMLRALGTALGKRPTELAGPSGLDQPMSERFPIGTPDSVSA